jgi:DNA replication protein DnaC
MCQECNDTGYLRSDIEFGQPGFGQLILCGCKARERAEYYQRLIGTELRPASLTALSTDNRPGTERMINAAREFIAKPDGWLTIWGTNGTGKSETLKSISHACLDKKIPVLYAPLELVVQWMKGGIEHPEFNVEARADVLAHVSVLCLDEVTGVRWTAWVAEQVETLLDRRYSARLATVLAMDEEPKSKLHPRLVSRISEGVVINNTDRDFRSAIRAAKGNNP